MLPFIIHNELGTQFPEQVEDSAVKHVGSRAGMPESRACFTHLLAVCPGGSTPAPHYGETDEVRPGVVWIELRRNTV